LLTKSANAANTAMPLHGGRHPPLDEVTPALFDQRAVVAAADPEELEPTSAFADLLIKYENNGPSKYINIHQSLLMALKIRKNYTSIRKIYTMYYFPICHYIHQQASPSITVL
jgi:hypothetical protein